MFKLTQVVCLVLLGLYLVTASSAQPFSQEQKSAIQTLIDETLREKVDRRLQQMEATLDKIIDEIEKRHTRPSAPPEPVHKHIYPSEPVRKHIYTARHMYTPRRIYRWDDPCCW